MRWRGGRAAVVSISIGSCSMQGNSGKLKWNHIVDCFCCYCYLGPLSFLLALPTTMILPPCLTDEHWKYSCLPAFSSPSLTTSPASLGHQPPSYSGRRQVGLGLGLGLRQQQRRTRRVTMDREKAGLVVRPPPSTGASPLPLRPTHTDKHRVGTAADTCRPTTRQHDTARRGQCTKTSSSPSTANWLCRSDEDADGRRQTTTRWMGGDDADRSAVSSRYGGAHHLTCTDNRNVAFARRSRAHPDNGGRSTTDHDRRGRRHPRQQPTGCAVSITTTTTTKDGRRGTDDQGDGGQTTRVEDGRRRAAEGDS